jgi:hypothetical protein
MKTQTPNPLLKNTAIFVGNDTELRKKAIEYYEKEGYPKFEMNEETNYPYISTMDDDGVDCVSDFEEESVEGCKIITIPEPEKLQPMTSERIKEIQLQTPYPDSISVQQALLQVWNECEQYFNQKLNN